MLTPMRCAIYARFSSDLQKDTSLEDQVATATRYAEAHGWIVEQVYTDAAVSGASLDRPGIQALLTAAAEQSRPDVLLVDDSSRVSRDLADAVRFLQQLKFFGIRVLYLSQGIDSASPQAETLAAVHGLVDGLYLREMATKIKRGLRGQLERGYATGGITFGYRTVPIPDPSGKTLNGYPLLVGKRVEVVPEEAAIVVQIFELYANGYGIGRIVEKLNRDGVLGWRGRPWRAGAVKRLLVNEKYRGLLIWGKKSFERRPGTRQYVERQRPRKEWHTLERPDLQIVSNDLWQQVQARCAEVRQTLPARPLMQGGHAALYSRKLFAGFLTCGVCGGAIATTSGGHGSPRYGCLRAWRNGPTACANKVTVRAKVVERVLLERLQTELLAPATVAYITQELTARLNQVLDTRPRQLEEARTAREQAVRKLQRLIDAVEQGAPTEALNRPIADRQAEITRLDATLAHLQQAPDRLAILPSRVRGQLAGLAGVLSMAPERTKLEFRRLSLRVQMQPIQAPRPFYRATVTALLPELAGVSDLASKGDSTTPLAGKYPRKARVNPAILEQIRSGSTAGPSHLPGER
jgi:DNA invertase Pin-like site-specific DNA recombinase